MSPPVVVSARAALSANDSPFDVDILIVILVVSAAAVVSFHGIVIIAALLSAIIVFIISRVTASDLAVIFSQHKISRVCLPVDNDRRRRRCFLNDDLLGFGGLLANDNWLRRWISRRIVLDLLPIALDISSVVMVVVVVVILVEALDTLFDLDVVHVVIRSALNTLLNAYVVDMVAMLLGPMLDPLFHADIVAVVFPGHA